MLVASGSTLTIPSTPRPGSSNPAASEPRLRAVEERTSSLSSRSPSIAEDLTTSPVRAVRLTFTLQVEARRLYPAQVGALVMTHLSQQRRQRLPAPGSGLAVRPLVDEPRIHRKRK